MRDLLFRKRPIFAKRLMRESNRKTFVCNSLKNDILSKKILNS